MYFSKLVFLIHSRSFQQKVLQIDPYTINKNFLYLIVVNNRMSQTKFLARHFPDSAV